MKILEVKSLTKFFGGLAAVKDVDLVLEEGEVLAVVGPNGAGKTTFFNLISGFEPPTRGQVSFMGENITNLPAPEIARRGLIRTFQANKIYSNLTTKENIMIGHYGRHQLNLGNEFLEKPENNGLVMEGTTKILQILDLNERGEELANNLPHGFLRMLGIGHAVAAGPKVLLLDEPASGMSYGEITKLMSVVRRLMEQGVYSVIIIDHNMRMIMKYSDRIAVLSYGEKIAEGQPEEIAQNPKVIEAYLGEGYATA